MAKAKKKLPPNDTYIVVRRDCVQESIYVFQDELALESFLNDMVKRGDVDFDSDIDVYHGRKLRIEAKVEVTYELEDH